MSNWNIGPYTMTAGKTADVARDEWQVAVADVAADRPDDPAVKEANEKAQGKPDDQPLIDAATAAAQLVVDALGGDCTVGLYGDTESGAVTIAVGRA